MTPRSRRRGEDARNAGRNYSRNHTHSSVNHRRRKAAKILAGQRLAGSSSHILPGGPSRSVTGTSGEANSMEECLQERRLMTST